MAATTVENFGSGNVLMAAMNMTEMIIFDDGSNNVR